MSKDDKKQELLAKRDQLIDRLEAIEKDYRQGLDADAEEQAVQLENAEVLAGIARAAREELDRIEKELEELE
ncbi:MAG: hypothetical protein PVG20_00125 [Thioalkalispiraceae bacterium]